MENCPFCSGPVRPEAHFCSACGKKLPVDVMISPPSDAVSSSEPEGIPPPSENAPPLIQVATSQLEHVPQEKAMVMVSEAATEEAMPAGGQPSVMENEGHGGEQGDEGGKHGGLVECGEGSERGESGESGENSDHNPDEKVPLVLGKEEVIRYRATIAKKLLGLVPFAKAENRERNRVLFERHSQRSLAISETSWGQVAYVTGVYGHLMGGNLLDTQRKLALWQALMWAVQYEYFFRPGQFDERFLRVAEFLHACAKDETFQTTAMQSLEAVLFEFDKPHLKGAHDELEKLPASPVLLTLKQMLERYTTLSEHRQVIQAMEHLWRLLDSKKEELNQGNLAEFRRSGPTMALLLRLVTMAVFICRNALFPYTHGMPENGKRLSDKDLQDVIVLADFARRYATGGYAVEAQKYASLLRVLQEVYAGRTSPDVFHKLMAEPDASNGTKDATAAQATHTEPSQAAQPMQRTQLAQDTDARLVAVPGQDKKPVKRGSNREILAHIFEEEQLAKLLECMRSFRLEQMRALLRRARKPLLLALSKALDEPSFDELQPPRRTFDTWANIRDDAFSELRKHLLGSDKAAQLNALARLDQAARGAVDREQAVIAREWLLFARANALGLDKALPAWREDYGKGIATAQEIWNLAVVSVRSGDRMQALEILKPGVLEKTAPLSHLRLALKCGVDILQATENYTKEPFATVALFLLEDLIQPPLPECYLVWLLLAIDVPEQVDASEQSRIIGIFLDLLDRPIQIVSSDRRSEEISIEQFEDEFQGLLSIVQRLEENYTLEPQDGHIVIKGKTLSTLLRPAQVMHRRVGLFVDYENLRPLLLPSLQSQPKEVGAVLTQHASKYGEVVCRWLCAAPRNIPNSSAMSEGFQDAGYRVQYPRGRTGQLSPTENLTDFVLVECITFEMTNSKPDVYIIVSGDGDYYEKIMRLIEQGFTVRLIATTANLASRYIRLAQRSKQGQLPEEYGGFFIDRLEEIFFG